jgi:hypothetical protein
VTAASATPEAPHDVDPGADARASDSAAIAVRADLDVPGETSRQARVFAIWFFCLAFAVILAAVVGRVERGAALDPDPTSLSISRARRFKVAALVGLLLPSLLTFGMSRHHRRGGAHARGIVVDVTDGELRIWGRGYGARVTLRGAEVKEHLVDVYAGRLGAWRQRRMTVLGPSGAGGVRAMGRTSRCIEIATPALERDMNDGLRVEGGEGTCVELSREDYELVRTRVLELSGNARS